MRSTEPDSIDAETLIETCAVEALALLRENLGPLGFLAAAPGAAAQSRGYDRVFGRDAAICALAALHCGDRALAAGARLSLESLASRQAGNGQIPKYVDGRGGADFWYLGCIDATLWWLIAVQHAGLIGHLSEQVARALDWLACQEHPQFFLLQQNEASDWADIMPRSGFVLYTNALWYHVKRIYALPHAAKTHEHFNYLFDPFADLRATHKRVRLMMHYVRRRRRHASPRELYLSFVNLASWGEEGDLFGNLLAVLFGLAGDHQTCRILAAIARNQAGAPYPMRVTQTPIQPAEPLWRPYMARHRQNLAHRYHNGGIWPFVGGFWVMALDLAGRRRQAETVLADLARASAAGGWQFNEWFHGLTGEPEGMPRQSWNAAMFLLARRSLSLPLFGRGIGNAYSLLEA
ncbi:MAG: hypothetical protein KF778_23010 [Rhodocyclaceae bacterium]|nr:hypothetical protein [Rhodocyclaceae bacterium]MBX3671278.1 hypothetical protein [Rhodocyclaceae bacterium]